MRWETNYSHLHRARETNALNAYDVLRMSTQIRLIDPSKAFVHESKENFALKTPLKEGKKRVNV